MKKINLQGKYGVGRYAIVDDDDFDRVSKYLWYVKWYERYGCVAVRVNKLIGGKVIYLHRLVTNCPEGMAVDHINRDVLDNRKENLRVCENKRNVLNRGLQRNNISGFMGVFKQRGYKKWCAQITIDGITRHLGVFVKKEDAARVYDRAAIAARGEFALTNEMQGNYLKQRDELRELGFED